MYPLPVASTLKGAFWTRALPIALFAVALLLCSPAAGEDSSIYGTWRLNAEESTDLAPWMRRKLWLEIGKLDDAVTIVQDWRHRGRGSWVDSLTIRPGRDPVRQIVDSQIWPENWFMGVIAKVGSEKITRARWLEPGRALVTEVEELVEVSQGESPIFSTCEYAVDRTGNRLKLTEERSTRPTPVRLIFDRVTGEVDE